jgi:hypothetical protein
MSASLVELEAILKPSLHEKEKLYNASCLSASSFPVPYYIGTGQARDGKKEIEKECGG